jgi:hypothetical protein
MTTLLYCDRCGGALDSGALDSGAPGTGAAGGEAHAACRVARALEPPRFCGHCARRMKVQVLPAGWRAVCVEHGESRSSYPST